MIDAKNSLAQVSARNKAKANYLHGVLENNILAVLEPHANIADVLDNTPAVVHAQTDLVRELLGLVCLRA